VTRLPLSFVLNGRMVQLSVSANRTLLDVLRDDLGATEVKYGCGEGVCGTCTVLMDGESVNACTVLGVQAAGASITTVRGLPPDGADMHPLQRRFLEHGASQCGFCTAGMLLVAEELVRANPRATRDEIRIALAGNLCRCTGYTKIVDAVEAHVRDLATGVPAEPPA
jgi:aerobic-type carbon monoxide dehydrogenase small subunit (CoxS/CutS family)